MTEKEISLFSVYWDESAHNNERKATKRPTNKNTNYFLKYEHQTLEKAVYEQSSTAAHTF